MRPTTVFLVLTFCFGLLFLLFTPPGQGPDDLEHFYRAYQVSNGDWLSTRRNNLVGGPLPKDLLVVAQMVPRGRKGRQQKPTDVLEKIHADRSRAQSEQTMFVHVPNMALNFPILYLPQASGIAIGKVFSASPVALTYLARFANLLAWVVIVFLAIKTIPMAKWLMLMVALTPMSLYLATSMSADTLTYGLCFLFVAVVMNLAYGHTSVGMKSSLLLLTLCVLVTLSKVVYIALIPLLFLIPRARFKSNGHYLSFIVSCFGLTTTMAFLWSRVVLFLYLPASLGETPDPEAQIGFILSDPFRYLLIFTSTIDSKLENITQQLIGVLGWLDTPLPLWFYLMSYTAIGLVSLFDQTSAIRLRFCAKFIILAVITVGIFLIFTGLYIKWTSVGSPVVMGIQGRYFIPLSFLFWLLFYRLSIFDRETSNYLGLSVFVYCAAALSYVSWLLLNRYYII